MNNINHFFLNFNTKKLKLILSLFSLFIYSHLSFCQEFVKDKNVLKFAKKINKQTLKNHLKILTSDSLEGRETGEIGQKKAANYILNIFKNYNLDSIDETRNYQQYFQIQNCHILSANIFIGKDTFNIYQDFYILGDIPSQNLSLLKTEFIGYGISTTGYNDYEGKNLKDKVVCIMSGEPKLPDGKYVLSSSLEESDWGKDWRKKSILALESGAKIVLIIGQKNKDSFNQKSLMIENYQKMNSVTNILNPQKINAQAIFISPFLASKLLNVDTTKIFIKNSIETKKTSSNVMGIVKGSEYPDEYIVISAHYDHLGKKQSMIFHGADDDGSGTVSLLELAHYFAEAKKMGFSPKKSILFLAVSGEEKGLLGSSFFVNNPIIPLEKIIANLNIDMIGRVDESHKNNHYIYLIGSDRLSKDLDILQQNVNKTYSHLKLDYTYNDSRDPNRFYYRSDHYNFAKNNIPVIFYFSGIHKDYHQTTDTYNKIDYAKIKKTSQLIFCTAWHLANLKGKLKLNNEK